MIHYIEPRELKKEEKDMQNKSKENVKSVVKGKKNSVKKNEMKSTASSENIMPPSVTAQLNNLSADTDANLIDYFGQPRAYIIQDCLATNNMLNAQVSLLNTQTQSDKIAYEQADDPDAKEMKLQLAITNIKSNAFAMAAIVQAKVSLLKAMKG